MDKQERARYAFFVGFTPIVAFFDGLVLLNVLRQRFPVSVFDVGWAGSLVLLSFWMYRWRPRAARAGAARMVLILLGILVAAAAVLVAAAVMGNLVVAGAAYLAGIVLEFVVGNSLLRRAGVLPIRARPDRPSAAKTK